MAFSRPEYWSAQPFPSPGDLPNPGIEPRSPALQADSLPSEPQGKPYVLTTCWNNRMDYVRYVGTVSFYFLKLWLLDFRLSL